MWPVTRFFAVETILSFGWDLKKSFDKKVWPVTHVFAVQTILSFWMGLGKIFDKNVCPVTHFFAVETILSFWWDLEKVSTKKCAQLHVSSLWRLTWVFDGTCKNFHKKVCPVTRFVRCGDFLSFGWDLKKFWQKGVTSYTFFRSACYLKFWIGLRKVSTKMCAQLQLWRVS